MKPLNSVLLQIFIAAIFCEITSSEEEVDPCKKQPFRGRCPGPNGVQQRSQFVLRYHVKNGECVSYPYGHCNNDDNEPKLFRYKDECEQNCLTKRSRVEGVGIVNVEDGSSDGETYATLGPFSENSTEDSSKTECQKLRDHSDKGGFVPQCTAHGDFVPLQCEPGDLICFCVDENGVEIKHSRCKPGEPKPDCEKIRIASPMRTNECTGPSDSGPCVDEIDRWLFDELTQQCRMFKYSGCGGNGNNYPNEQICQQHCIVPVESIDSICGGGIHQRPLKDFNGVTVSCAKTECPAGYKCTGDHKNFVCCPDISKITSTSTTPSQSEFESAESRCNLPKDKGSCDNYMLRFYFNKEIGQCKHFFYGGCEGNTNNFFNLEECEAVCTGKKVESSSTTLAPATNENHLLESTIGLTNSPDISEITSTEGGESTTEPKKSEVHPQVFGDRRIEKQPLPPPTQPPTTTTTAEQPTPKTTRRRATITTTSTRATTTVDLSENRCHHPKDSGDCGGQFARWFWNQDEKSCEAFIYTGCNGNGNNFANREECLTICHEEAMTLAPSPHTTPDIENACESEIEPGDCTGVFMRYGFDIHTGECRQFQYGGCGGNGNNFGSMSECKRKCLNKSTVLSNNICDHPIDSGECNGAFTRFGYDNDENVCRQFVYGGCSGNGNNFPTMADCRMACIKVKCPPEPKCETSKCQLVNDARGCPFCSCPPTQPIRTLPEIPRLPACSPIDEQLCVEPCVIFVNRRNCKECVCPSTQPIPQLFHSKAPKQPSKTGGDFIDFKHVFEQPTPPPDVLLPPAFTDFATLRPAPPAPETHERTGSTRVDVTNGPPAPPSPPAAFGTQGVTNNNVDALPPPKQPAQPPIPPPTFINVEICTLPLDTGNPACTKTNQRWYFNSLQGECESFVYTGCAGNRNHFFSQRECQIFCARFSRPHDKAPPQSTIAPAPLPTASAPIEPPFIFQRPVQLVVEQQSTTEQTIQPSTTGQTRLRSTTRPTNPPSSPSSKQQFVTQEQLFTTRKAPERSRPTVAPSTVPPLETDLPFKEETIKQTTRNDMLTRRPPHFVVQKLSPPTPGPRRFEFETFEPPTIPSQEPPRHFEFETIKPPTIPPQEPPQHFEFETQQPPSSQKPLLKPVEARPRFVFSTLLPPLLEPEPKPKVPIRRPQPINRIVHLEPPTVVIDRGEGDEISTKLPETTIEIEQQTTESAKLPEFEPTFEKEPELVQINETVLSTDEPEQVKSESTDFLTIPSTVHSEPETLPSVEQLSSEAVTTELPLLLTDEPELTPPSPTTEREFVEEANTSEIIKVDEPEVVVEILTSSTIEPFTTETSTTPSTPSTFSETVQSVKSTESTISLISTVTEAPITSTISDSPALPVETSPPASVLVPFNNKHDHTSNEERVEITIQDSHFTAPSVQSQPETLATLAVPIVPRDRIIVPKADESDDTCILPPDAGPCRDFVHRWFYNSQTERCEPFSYGSCAGNKNNFAELSLCESKCIAEMNPSAKLPPRCAHERDDGEGNGYFPKWYFNRHNLRCEQFVYRGQLGNDNQFSTQHDCESYCQNDQEVTQTPQPTPPRKIPVIVPPSEDRILKTPPAEIKPIAPDEIILKGARITEVDGNVESPKPMLSPPPVSPPPTNAGYDAVLLPKDEPKINPAEMPPILGPSPPMELNYATGERFDGKNNQTVTNRVGGIKNFPIRPDSDKPFPVGSFDPKFVSTSFGKASEQVENQPSVASTTETNVMDNDVAETSPTENVPLNQTNEEQSVRYHIPVCPNGLNSMQYADGRPVMCLPGKDHCPNKSVCYFNGLDYFCCPNDDDPYDQHIFGGYDGEEVKHGYKYTIEKSGIRRSRFLKRSKRQQQGVSISERAPEKLAHTKQKSLSRMSPCVQRVQKGNCSDSKLRFYYDVIVDECRLFYFSGCDGNSNNFVTRQECEQRCKIGPIITMMPPVSIPPGRCPGLPLGGNNPVLCGNRTDSIGCPQGYYCRSGPPDVCCPTNSDNRIYEAMAIAEQRNRNEIRRKPFISTASAQDKEYIGQNEHNKLHYNPNQDDWQQHEHQFQEQGRSIDEEPPLENNQQQHQTEQSQSMSPQQNNTDSPPAIALAAPTQLEVQASSDDFEQQPLHDSPKAHGTSEKLFCPDGSDGLASQSGTPMICGTGFDGHQLCPQGYYCSMDHEKNSRLCCELTVRGSQIPAAVPNSIPPYFGHRPANPEEVIPKGSLPSDPKPPKLKVPSPKLKTQLDEELPADDIGLQEDESKTAVLVDERANNQTELDHLFIQPPSVDRVYGRANKNLPNIPPKDWEGVGAEDPFDDVELSNEEPNDKKASICILPPNEGRICKKDEPTPYSNLQFFYNANERRCKVFFHKGCGGNANRFRTKKECEDYCLQQAQN